MKNLRIIFTLFLSLTAASLVAQSRHYSAASLGIGGGGTAYIDGYNANFVNPANLMLNTTGRKPSTSIGLIGNFGVRAGGSLANISVYNKYLTNGDVIEGDLRTNMLNEWFGTSQDNTRDLAVTASVIPIAFSTRLEKQAFSLAIRSKTVQDLSLNKGFMELAFYGLDSDQFGGGVPVNFNSYTNTYVEISLGYAREIPIPFTSIVEAVPFVNSMKLYAGVAPKYIVGLQSVEMDFTSTLTVLPVNATSNGTITHDFQYSLYSYGKLSEQLEAYSNARLTDPNASLGDYLDYDGSDLGTLGSGFGLDLGLTAELDVSIPVLGFFGDRQKLRVSMSVTDLGSITYDNKPSVVRANDVFVFDGDIGDQGFGDYFDNLQDSLENDVYGGFTSQELSSKKYSLPGMYNFGASLSLGKLTTTFDYGIGFNNRGANIESGSVNLGLEYRFFNFLPVRVGTRMGGYSSASYSAGLGLDFRFFEFTFAAAQVANSENSGSSATVAWSGLVFRF